MKRFFLISALFSTALLAGCGTTAVQPKTQPTGQTPQAIACTQEAKLCPDGSYVGRTGPKCEFTACSTTGTNEAYTIVDKETSAGRCETDSDCSTPETYLMRSSCPYTSKCIKNTCFVVCPNK